MTTNGFNRTFMELKYAYFMPSVESVYCFNRTFMELKCSSPEWMGADYLTF